MTGLTEHLAQFIVRTHAADFPGGMQDKAKKVIADTFSAIVGSVNSDVAAPLSRYLEESGESGDSPILGTARRSSPELAALVNASHGAALEFDDVLSIMPGHPSAIVVSALIAGLKPGRLSGASFIEAYAIGIETGAKIAVGLTLGHYNRGFHATGTVALFSAVAALCKAQGLDAPAIRNAFGIAASMSAGLMRNFGTMTKPLHSGWAARCAIAAVGLTRSGFSAAQDALEGANGYFAAYGTGQSDPQLTIQALANPWMFMQPGVTLKKFPCCYVTHRGLHGLLGVKAELGLTADNLKSLHCRMPPGGMKILTFPEPRDGLEAKFSMEYSLAAGVLDEVITLWTFGDEAVRRPAIAALLKKIRVSEEECCRGDDPLFEKRSSGTRGWVEVEAETTDGRRAMRKVVTPPGHPSQELSWADMRGKFHICMREAGLPQAREEAAWAMLAELDRQPDVQALLPLLTH